MILVASVPGSEVELLALLVAIQHIARPIPRKTVYKAGVLGGVQCSIGSNFSKIASGTNHTL